MSKKIGVIGDGDSIRGFSAIGMDIFPVTDAGSAAKKLREWAEDYAIIYITENICAEISKEIERYKNKALPAVIAIPNASGSIGYGMDNIRRITLKAVGTDLVFNEK